MSFLYPAFLFALAVLAIPLIIHLFHFRRYKTVLFSNVKFLRAADTERKNQNKLKHLLVLTARLLAFAALVLAFAIPGCKNNAQSTGKSAVTIYVDNSFSMEHRNADGILLEIAKQKARDIIKSLGETAEYQIISNEPSASASVFSSPLEATRKVDEIQSSPRSPSIGRVWQQIQDQLSKVPNEIRKGYVISDFQSSFMREIPKEQKKNAIPIQCLKLDITERKNIDIDTAWILNPFTMAGEKTTVKFRVFNYSSNILSELNIRLMMEGSVRGIAKMEIPAFSYGEAEIEFTMPSATYTKAWLEVDDADNVFDNKLYFSLQPQGDLKITVKGTNEYLNKALGTNGFFKIQQDILDGSNVIYYANCAGISLAESNQLAEKVRNGASVTIVPAKNLQPAAWKELESIFGIPRWKEVKKGKFNLDRNGLTHSFFNQVFTAIPKNMEMPSVTEYYSTAGSLGSGEAVLSLENGDPFLIRYRLGKGYLYCFTADFSTTSGNFVQSALFLPVVVNCAFNYNQTGNIYGVTAANKGYLLKHNFKNQENNLILNGDKKEFVPEVQNGIAGQELFLGSYLNNAGFYLLQDKKNSSTKELVALNFPRTESDPRAAAEESLKLFKDKTGAEWINANNSVAIAQLDSAESHLWRLFIWLAAAFFAVEVLLLIFWDPMVAKMKQKITPVNP